MNQDPGLNATSIPYTVLFGLIVVLLVRSGELRPWIAIVTGLFGFYLASSGAAPVVRGVVGWFVGGVFHSY